MLTGFGVHRNSHRFVASRDCWNQHLHWRSTIHHKKPWWAQMQAVLGFEAVSFNATMNSGNLLHTALEVLLQPKSPNREGTTRCASVWSCERFYVYLRCLHLTVEIDHKPLIPLINNKDLCDVPLRCQRLLMRLMKYKCTAVYTPGKFLVVVDALSREPLKSTEDGTDNLEEEIEAHIDIITKHWPVSKGKLAELKHKTALDDSLKHVKSYVTNG